jgi:hypothetical protein
MWILQNGSCALHAAQQALSDVALDNHVGP